MPITKLHGRDGGTLRDFQQQMTEVGRIRLGDFVTDGKGRPNKLDCFRFTSEHRELIEAIAELYGGEPRAWTPRGARAGDQQWEVYSETNAVPVYLPQQVIDPNYEAWRPGTCIRRCDGVFERLSGEACPCHNGKITNPQDLCKPTIHVLVMLARIPGLGTWRFTSHGEHACQELSTPAALIASAPQPIGALLYLRRETRRVPNGNGFVTNVFYVPSLRIDAVTAQDIAIGGDALSRALAAAGGMRMLAGSRAALELPTGEATPDNGAAGDEPTTEPVAATVVPPAVEPASVEVSPEERRRILAAIEGADLAGLDAIRTALMERNIRAKVIQDAWVSKRAALQAAAEVGGSAPGPQAAGVTAGNAEHQQSLRAAVADAKREAQATVREVLDGPSTEPPFHDIGDQVTVGGVTFTKIAEDADAFGPGVLDDVIDVEEVPPVDHESVVEYDPNEQYMLITSLANGLGWTTARVNEYIREVSGVSAAQATGAQLKGVLAAMQLKLREPR